MRFVSHNMLILTTLALLIAQGHAGSIKLHRRSLLEQAPSAPPDVPPSPPPDSTEGPTTAPSDTPSTSPADSIRFIPPRNWTGSTPTAARWSWSNRATAATQPSNTQTGTRVWQYVTGQQPASATNSTATSQGSTAGIGNRLRDLIATAGSGGVSNRIIGGVDVPKGSASLLPRLTQTATAWASTARGNSRQQPAATSATSNRPEASFRIVGGLNATQGRFPFIVSLRDPQGRHYCGGSLIAPNVVMTAAHCLDQTSPGLRYPAVQLNKFYTNINENGVIYNQCIATYIHEGWSFSTGRNDISLCFLSQPVTAVAPIELARATLSDANTALTVMGWGSQREGSGNSQTLQYVQVYLTDSASCNYTYSGRIGPNQYCAGLPLGGADACQGDSGGPLLVVGDQLGADVQYGIVSWGSGCGEPGKPGVYTNVAAYVPWIQNKLQTVLGSSLPEPLVQQQQQSVVPSDAPIIIAPPSSPPPAAGPAESPSPSVIVTEETKPLDTPAPAGSPSPAVIITDDTEPTDTPAPAAQQLPTWADILAAIFPVFGKRR